MDVDMDTLCVTPGAACPTIAAMVSSELLMSPTTLAKVRRSMNGVTPSSRAKAQTRSSAPHIVAELDGAWAACRAAGWLHLDHGGHHVDIPPEMRKAAFRRPFHNAPISLEKFGVGVGIRTLDPNLGKIAFCLRHNC